LSGTTYRSLFGQHSIVGSDIGCQPS
jgi:hypothetical protein